jgi:hypothetical protein
MFILDGKPLSPDNAFTHDGVNYPANWLRLATPEEREAIGITEVPDPAYYDQRFYWGPDQPKDHAELVELYCGYIKLNANSILSQTDWYITRFSETGIEAPQSVLDRRSEVRVLSNEKETFLRATESTQELAEYVTSPEYSRWEPPNIIEDNNE